MTSVALIGGGRWGRVHASVLDQILSSDDKVIWLSRFGDPDALRSLVGRVNVVVCRSLDELWSQGPDCCVVASTPDSHARYAKEAIRRHLPVLVEKPLCLDADDFADIRTMAHENGCPVGTNLVFLYASYLQDFAAELAHGELRRIEIVWHDTECEMRYGETKTPDYYTSQVDDMFPHCWSILRLFNGASSFRPSTVSAWPDGRIELFGRIEQTEISISMSRFDTRRQRLVRVDGDQEIDFAQEPGFTTVRGRRAENVWRGNRPMTQSLLDFLRVSAGTLPQDAWRLAIDCCADSFPATQIARRLARLAQRQYLAERTTIPTSQLLDEASNLLLDLYLPEQSRSGPHRAALGKTDRREISALALSYYRNDLP